MTSRRTGSSASRPRLDDRRVHAARPTLECADAREQLAEVEGLDEVVVGAGVEALDPVGWRVARGEHQQRRRAVVPSGPGDDVDAGCAGHAPVDDRDVVLVPLELVDGVVAALDGVDLVALVLESEHEDFAQAGVVLGDEHSHGAQSASSSCRMGYGSGARGRRRGEDTRRRFGARRGVEAVSVRPLDARGRAGDPGLGTPALAGLAAAVLAGAARWPVRGPCRGSPGRRSRPAGSAVARTTRRVQRAVGVERALGLEDVADGDVGEAGRVVAAGLVGGGAVTLIVTRGAGPRP